MGTGQAIIGQDRDIDEERLFKAAQMHALLIEHIKRNIAPRLNGYVMCRALQQEFLNRPQHMQRNRWRRANHTRSNAMRTDNGRAFQNARPNALT